MSASPSSGSHSPTTIVPHDEVVLAVAGNKLMDDRSCRELAEVVLPAATARRQPVVLDLSQVRFLPSIAIGALTNLLKDLKAQDQRLVMIHVQPNVRQVFAITKMDRVFELAETLEAALTRIRAAAAATGQPVE
jgi:anti-sigma B factor antagonist